VYKGIRTTADGHQNVWKVGINFDNRMVTMKLDPEPSQKLINHSPDGFQWGSVESLRNGKIIKTRDGASQLALALLLDVTGDSGLSVALHQDFKNKFVATWGESWQMEADEILHWVRLRRCNGGKKSPKVEL